MERVSIQGCRHPIAPLIIGSHGYAKEHEDKDFDEFVELGGNCIHMHGEGGETISRKNVASWIERRNNRDKMVLLFQICHGHDETTSRLAESRFSPMCVANDIEENLALLKTDYLDLVVLGGDNERIPASDIIEVLEAEKSRGRIHAYGIFNWSPVRIDEAQHYASSQGCTGISFVHTTELSLAIPTSPVWEDYIPFDAAMREVVMRRTLPVLAWTSDFNQSFFIPGATDRDTVPEDRRLSRWFTDENFMVIEKAKSLGTRHNLNERQVNVAYVLNQNFPTAALFYQDHDPRAQEYFEVLHSTLERHELRALRA